MTREAVSACLIVKDEAAFLGPCLQSLRGWVDEVLVADTGSTDGTDDIVTAAGARLIEQPWTGSFADARNAVAAEASGTWLFVIDADERLVPPPAPLRDVVPPDLDCVAVHLHNLRSEGSRVDRVPEPTARLGHPTLVPRLFRRTPDLLWEGIVHEIPVKWLRARRSRVGAAPVHLVHLGYAPTVWEGRGKAARNAALLRRRVIGNRDDPAALVLLAQHHLRCGRISKGVAAAESAWRLVADDHAAPLTLVQIVGTVLHAWARAGQMDGFGEVLATVDRWGAAEPWVRAERQHPNLLYLAAYHDEVCAVEERSTRARMSRLLAAARGQWAALDSLDAPRMAPVLDGITEGELRARHQLVVHQLGQRGFVRRAFATGVPESDLERALLEFELRIAEGHAPDVVGPLTDLAHATDDLEAWVVAAAASRGAADREGVAVRLAEAERVRRSTWRAGHRAFLLRDLVAWGHAGDGVDRAVIVGGVGRSGTTLLRAMLGAHPRLYAPPELKLLPEAGGFHERLAAFEPTLRGGPVDLHAVERAYLGFVRSVLESVPTGGRRLVEKTPANILHMELLARAFPGACFLHVIRDGRDVVASLLDQDWVDPSSGARLAICEEARKAAEYWRETVLRARCQSAWLLGRVLEVRYEELVRSPEVVLRRVLGFLGEKWDDRVLRHAELPGSYPPSESSSGTASLPVFTSSVGRWGQRLAAEDLAVVDDVAGDLLRELGYEAGAFSSQTSDGLVDRSRVR